jgi:hypothetical protein
MGRVSQTYLFLALGPYLLLIMSKYSLDTAVWVQYTCIQFSPLDPYYPLPIEDQLCLYKSGPPLPCYHPCKVWLHLVEKDIKIRRERRRTCCMGSIYMYLYVRSVAAPEHRVN